MKQPWEAFMAVWSLAILMCAVPGLILLCRGLLGCQLSTEPWFRSGYDLRKTRFEDDDTRPFPECGADLARPKALRIDKRDR